MIVCLCPRVSEAAVRAAIAAGADTPGKVARAQLTLVGQVGEANYLAQQIIGDAT